MLLSVGGEVPGYLSITNTNSALPTTLDQTAKGGGYLSHPNFPRLFPLSHQGVKSLYSFKDAEAYGGLLAGIASCSPRE